MNRREFIRNIGLGLGGLSPIMRMGTGVGLLSTTSFASPSLDNYKAIVIINLDGGNDAMNMFPPIESTAHTTYSGIRTNLASSLDNLYEDTYYSIDANGHFNGTLGNNQPYYEVDPDDPIAESNDIKMYTKGTYHTNITTHNDDRSISPTTTSTGLGINALMPEFASLYNKGKLSIISNVGTLVEPTTKTQIDNGTANLPVFLFAHNHQKLAVATAQSHILGKTGWAGRLADDWRVNGSVGLNISYAGPERTLIGESTSALSMGTNRPSSYPSVSEGDTIEELLIRINDNTSSTNNFDRFYNLKNKTTAQLSTLLTIAWESAPDFSSFTTNNSYGENLFTVYETNHKEKLGMLTHHGLHQRFFDQLEATAKMIKLSKDTLSHNRQIFYVRGTGYDSHSDQVHQHSRNLRTISLGISDFYKSLEEMEIDDEVLIVSFSEFGRTLKNNGDGTDHGWGGHNFILCGDPSFNGGNVFGEVMSDLTLDGVNSYTDRARIIPTTSIEQMLAPCLKWFGVSDSLMPTILPNLANFDAHTNTTNLQGMFTV